MSITQSQLAGVSLSAYGAYSSGGAPEANAYPPISGAGATGPGVTPAGWRGNAGPIKTVIAINQGTLAWLLGGALVLSLAWHTLR